MTLSKAQKIGSIVMCLITMLSIFASIAGTYLYVPGQINELKTDFKELVKLNRQDHDVVIEVKTKLESVEKRLDRTGIIQNEQYEVSTNRQRLATNRLL